MGKGENAGYQHLLLSQKVFKRPPISVSLKLGIVWYRASMDKLNTVQRMGNSDLSIGIERPSMRRIYGNWLSW